MSFECLPNHLLVAVLNYLRALDLASLCSASRSQFSDTVVSDSIFFQLNHIHNTFYQQKPAASQLRQVYRPWHLYIAENAAILAALQVSQVSVGEGGYFISSSWYSQAKKYLENVRCPELALACTKLTLESGVAAASSNVRDSPAVPLSAPSPSRPSSYATPPKKPKGRSSNSPASSTPTLSQQTALPRPGDSMTMDLVCPHGGLAPQHKLSKFRRRQVESRVYKFLHRFFPEGPTFRANCKECVLCVGKMNNDDQKAQIPNRRQADSPSVGKGRVPTIYILPEELEALFNRKSGVPSQCVASTGNAPSSAPRRVPNGANSMSSSALGSALSYSDYEADDLELALAMSISLSSHSDAGNNGQSSDGSADDTYTDEERLFFESENADGAAVSSSLLHSVQPLVPGIYHLVPRSWLRLWRQAVKSQNGSSAASSSAGIAEQHNNMLPSIDYTSLLCSLHGHFVVPPHLAEYLGGHRRQLLGQLGSYPGEVVEVISSEEWEYLQQSIKQLNNNRSHLGAVVGDYEIIFSLDGEHVNYSTTVCRKCDQFDYCSKAASERRKGPNSNTHKRK